MKDLLNSISVLATFVTTTMVCYYLFLLTAGQIKSIPKSFKLYKTIETKYLFLAISFIIVFFLVYLRFLNFYKPW